MIRNPFKKSSNSKKESASPIGLDDFTNVLGSLKAEFEKLMNDEDIKNQISEIKDEVMNGVKELSKIDFKNPAPEKLHYHEFDRPIVLKDVIEMSNKYKDNRASSIAMHHHKASNYELLTIFFLGKDNEPFIDESKDTFINLKSNEISEDLKSLLDGNKLVILN
jgi:hypothetical protein